MVLGTLTLLHNRHRHPCPELVHLPRQRLWPHETHIIHGIVKVYSDSVLRQLQLRVHLFRTEVLSLHHVVHRSGIHLVHCRVWGAFPGPDPADASGAPSSVLTVSSVSGWHQAAVAWGDRA